VKDTTTAAFKLLIPKQRGSEEKFSDGDDEDEDRVETTTRQHSTMTMTVTMNMTNNKLKRCTGSRATIPCSRNWWLGDLPTRTRISRAFTTQSPVEIGRALEE